MSSPDDGYPNSPPPPPPKERPLSQTSSHGIRIVPYSPPRLSRDERTASQSSSATGSSRPLSGSQQPSRAASQQYQPQVAAQRGSGNWDVVSDRRGSGGSDDSGVGSGSGGVGRPSAGPSEGDFADSRVYAAASQGRAPSSSVGAAKDGAVSGTKPAAPQSEGASRAAPPRTPPTASDWPRTLASNPSSTFNAPSQSQSEQTRRPLATRPTLTLAPKPPSSRLPSGPAGAAAAPAAAAGPGSSVSRPRSRRRNMLSMHSDNRTFSIVLNSTGKLPPGSSTSSARGSWSATGASASGSGTTRSTWASSQAGGSSSTYGGGITSPPLSLSTVRTVDSREGLSDAFLADDERDEPSVLSPLTSAGTIPDAAHFPFPPSPGEPSTRAHLTEDPKTPAHSSSPWNYRMVGGLRKVPNTPDFRQKQVAAQLQSSAREQSLSPLIEAASTPSPTLPHAAPSSRAHDDTPTRPLVSKDSFTSDRTVDTTSETSNYKVYARSSPPPQSDESLPLPSSSHSNYVLLGESSPVAPPSELHDPSPPPSSHASDDNYILHGDSSPSPSVSLVARRQPRPEFSQESLIVPPLQPIRRGSSERLGYYKSRSRESLRARANSAKSLKSITSIIAGESVQSILVNSALVPGLRQQQSPGGAGPSSSSFASRRQQLDSWASAARPTALPSGSQPQPQPQPQPQSQPQQFPMVEAHPHQWSSQLSTVMSETEPSSSERAISPISRTASRMTGSISNLSGAGTGSGSGSGRRQSTGWASSTHSRQMLSISSSLAAQLEEGRTQSRSMSMSRSDSVSLERPAAAYARNGYNGGSRTIRDHDEDGDGIADLRDLSPRPSRSGLSGFMSSLSDSSRNLHSSSSSRSFNSSALPTWARVYYGSGERRQLSAPSIISDVSEGPISRPGSALQRDPGSPAADHFPSSLFSPRRRVREVEAGPSQRPFSDQASLDIAPASPTDMDYNAIRPNLRKKTSSLWSPHLGMDRRAISSRYSRWDPPSVSWSAESGVWGRRNIQVVMFVLGFIFPFAWMIAAVLPLPEQPRLQMLERDHSQSELGISESLRRQFNEADDVRYQSAKWWRNLNRGMSLVGLVIIGIVVGLVVVGIQQGWYQRV